MAHEFKWKNALKNQMLQSDAGVSVAVARLERSGVDVDKLIEAMPESIEARVVSDTSTSPGNNLVHQEQILVLLPALKKRN